MRTLFFTPLKLLFFFLLSPLLPPHFVQTSSSLSRSLFVCYGAILILSATTIRNTENKQTKKTDIINTFFFCSSWRLFCSEKTAESESKLLSMHSSRIDFFMHRHTHTHTQKRVYGETQREWCERTAHFLWLRKARKGGDVSLSLSLCLSVSVGYGPFPQFGPAVASCERTIVFSCSLRARVLVWV